MATIQFKPAESPYVNYNYKADASDRVFLRYLSEATSTAGNLVKNFNLAIFGAGRAGTIHLGNAVKSNRCTVKYLVEANQKRAEDACNYFGLKDTVRLTPDQIATVINDSSIDGVIIATPTWEHEEVVIKILNARKGVMCEKPLAFNEEGIKKCYDLAAKNNVTLLCAMNRRFDPSMSSLRDRVHAGTIGQVQSCNTVSRDSPLPSITYLKASGGIIYDCGVHDFDMISWIFGEYPEKVCATGSSFIPEIGEINDFDSITITMKFPSGSISVTNLNRNCVYGYDQRIEVFGSKGMINVENKKPDTLNMSHVTGSSQSPICYSFPSRYYEAYQNELDHFFDLLGGSAQPIVTERDILNAHAICHAVNESIKKEAFVKVVY